MSGVATYTKSGNKATTKAQLPSSVFGVELKNHELLKTAYLAYLANERGPVARTKTRGEIRGGGKKPWRQKGTGRARFGSSRNPIWRGGGIVFGPTGEENHTIRLSRSSRQLAIRQALSLKAKAEQLSIIETFECKEGKVKPTMQLLKKMGAVGSILLVVSQKDDLVERATRNLPNVRVTQAQYLNVYDILNADTVIISVKSLDIINQWLGGKS